jgi:hypothetical protein
MASILRPDSGEYYILGSVNVEDNLEVNIDATIGGILNVGSDLTTNGRIVSSDIGSVNLESPDDPTSLPALDVAGGGKIGGDFYVGGTLLVNGDVITLGNSGGSVTFNSNISSDILPSVNLQYDIGSNSFYWKNLYCDNVISPSSSAGVSIGEETLIYLDGSSLETYTLDDAETVGSSKTIIVKEALTTVSGTSTITPTTSLGFTSFTFSSIGDSISLIYTDSGWAITSQFRTSINN